MNNRQPSAFSAGGVSAASTPLSNVSPEAQAVLDKLVPPVAASTPNQRAYITGRGLSNGTLQRISQDIGRDIYDAESLMTMLPDLELVRQIIVSLILSPKDMGPSEIQFRVNRGRFAGELTGQLLEVVREYYTSTYMINDLAQEILSDVMFRRGNYPILLLPENTIDMLINAPGNIGLESAMNTAAYRDVMRDNIGLLGPSELPAGVVPGTESAMRLPYNADVRPEVNGKPLDTFVRVVDNPNILKRARLRERIRRTSTLDRLRSGNLSPILRVRETQSASMEAINAALYTGGDGKPVISNTGFNANLNALYGRAQSRSAHMQIIPTPSEASRPSVGHPTELRLPSEAVIPLFTPGNPKQHVAYFVLIDEHGNPVSSQSSQDYYHEMGMALRSGSSMPSQLIQNAQRLSEGAPSNPERRQAIREMEEAYAAMVEADLYKRLKNGVAGDDIVISRPEEVYRLMLSRTMQRRQTQLLYVPAELMTYVAFEYDEFGVGVSYLQRSKIIAGLRAALLFANTHGAIKNSISRTRLKINVDPEDPDPMTTVEEFTHNHVRNSRGFMPVGISEPTDILTYFAYAAIEVEVTGNNPLYPETSAMVEEYASQAQKPDTELEDSLKARHHMIFGLSPEMVDQAKGADFATTLIQQNIMLSKRVYQWQNKFLPHLSDHIRRYTINSGPLIDRLRQIVIANRGKLTRQQVEAQQAAIIEGEVEVDADLAELVTVLDGGPRQKTGSVTDDSLTRDQLLAVDAVVLEFVQSIELGLPRPENALIKQQQEALEGYSNMLEKGIEAYLSQEFLGPEFMSDMSEVIEPTRKALHAYFMRVYMQQNNIMPELQDLTKFTEANGPALELLKAHSAHIEGLRRTLIPYMAKLTADLKVQNDAYTKLKDAASGSGGGSDWGSSSSSDSGSSWGSDTSNDDGGGDGGDDAGGIDDNPPGMDDLPADDAGGDAAADDAPPDDEAAAPPAF